jgi:hypothetical protein
MEYVHGKQLMSSAGAGANSASSPESAGAGAFAAERAGETAEALGRVFVLDMLLGNPDRLPCQRLTWRGNPGMAISLFPFPCL